MRSPILAASDGSRSAFGALRVAHGLAERDDRPLHVLVVLQPVELPGLGGRYPLPGAERNFEHRLRADLEQAVREQLDRLGIHEPHCRLLVRIGAPAQTIARYAAEIEAAQVVIGFPRTTALERLGASEMPVRIVQLASAPVLAVPHDAEALPQRAVVAIDFSDFSLEAARAALALVGSSGEVHLVHVLQEQPLAYGWWPVEEGARQRYRSETERELAEVAREIAGPAAGAVHSIVLGGDPAQAVLDYARRVEADLVGAGTHGYGFFSRLVLGSVSTRLLRGAGCAVLLVPPEAVTSPTAELQTAGSSVVISQADPDQEC